MNMKVNINIKCQDNILKYFNTLFFFPHLVHHICPFQPEGHCLEESKDC